MASPPFGRLCPAALQEDYTKVRRFVPAQAALRGLRLVLNAKSPARAGLSDF
jgi:hypothetical protein